MFFGPRTPVLILGGSSEARHLAVRFKGRASVMLPGPERTPQAWPVPVSPFYLSREALAARLDYGVRVLVDASHPCDLQSSVMAADIATQKALPLLRLERPPWRPQRTDTWHMLRDEAAVARAIGPGNRVLLTTGRETLHRFLSLQQCYVYCRQLTPHNDVFPLPRGRFLRGSAPFTLAQEQALLRRLGINWLVLRNAGGSGGWPKLAAARALGLPVAMLSRPIKPAVPTRHIVSDAETWITSCLT